MSWLKRDDQRCLHPKIGELTDREYRALDALYEYCARARNNGYYHTRDLRHALYATPRGPRSPSRQMNEKWTRLRLVDSLDRELYRIHDWDVYQPKDPTGAERKRLERERKQEQSHATVTEQSPDTEVTVTGKSRDSRARPPSRPEEDLKAEQYSVRQDAALPSDQDLEDEDLPDKSDPVIRLLLALRDRDEGTERVLRSFTGQVSEAAFDFTRDEIERTGGGAGKAVAILKRIREEGTLASPDRDEPDEPEFVKSNGSGSGPAYIAGLIRNGVLTDRADLETELDLAGVEDEDRSSLVAQLQLAQQLEGRE